MNAPDWTRDMPADDEVSRLRVPPHSVEAEQSVLGALLIDCNAFDRCGDLLAESDFYRSEHRPIWSAIAALDARGRGFDVITVHEQLRRMGREAEAVDLPYLNALAQSVPSAANIRRYAEIVAERSLLRQVIATCDEGATSAFNPQGRKPADVVADLAEKLSRLERRQQRRMPRTLAEIVPSRVDRVSAMERGEVPPGLPTGIPRLDRYLSGGLRGGAVYVLAARPSVGKSSLAQAIGLHVAEKSGPVLMLSQEMPDGEVADRAMANLGGLSYTSIQTGSLQGDEWERLTNAVEAAVALPFYVDDQPALRLRDIGAKARQVKGLRLLIVDYLQLSVGDGDNRVQQVGDISRGVKALAKAMDIPVLLLSQLSRKVEERPGKEPEMSDLRDSGEIEQDADVVLFLWPAQEYPGGAKQVAIKCPKQRNGPRDWRFGLHFNGAHQQWHESADDLPRRGAGSHNSGSGFE